MKPIKIRKILTFHSLFSRWILFFLIGVMAINISVLIFFNALLEKRISETYEGTQQFWVDSVTNQLGTPPDKPKASRITADSGILIRYEGPGDSWATSDRIPAFSDLNKWSVEREVGMTWIPEKASKRYLLVRNHNHLFLFQFPPSGTESRKIISDALILIFSILAVFGFAFIYFKWLFKPLQQLSKGLSRVSQGDIGHTLPEQQKGELGDMSRQFNQMSRQIEQMMLSRKQLLQDVSHELRSPLMCMKLSLAAIPESREKNEVESDITEMNITISRLLEFSRLDHIEQAINLEPTDILELARSIVDQMKRRHAGIRLISSINGLVISIDPSEMRIVLDNLLDNALKFATDTPEPIILVVEKTADSVIIRVRDHGPGIPSKDIPFLFEPFYRVNKSRSSKIDGHGLGLSICQRIVTAHHGKIDIRSVENEGTEIIVELPL